MLKLLRLGVLVLALGGCAAQGMEAAPAAAPAGAPELRSGLGDPWVEGGKIKWPPANGFTDKPVLMVLPPGLLLDRFGSEGGRFFSPKGASYGGRALPYVCATLVYHVYRVEEPLLAWSGAASPWFGETGGATQLQTDATAAQLIADGVLAAVPDSGPSPCPK